MLKMLNSLFFSEKSFRIKSQKEKARFNLVGVVEKIGLENENFLIVYTPTIPFSEVV